MKINILEFLLKKLEHYAQNIHSYLLYVVHHQDLPVQISAATIKNNGTKWLLIYYCFCVDASQINSTSFNYVLYSLEM